MMDTEPKTILDETKLPGPESADYKIPPIIHYVWVGGKEKPELIKRCMKSWKKHAPAYTFIEWNESNFDIAAHPFTAEAYRQKKWAFVSDYIRAWALERYGGIYLDTDNVLCGDLDEFRKNRAFVGFEREDYCFTACFGTEKGHPLVRDIMHDYDGRVFVYDPENPLPLNNTISVSELLIEKYGAVLNNEKQLLKEGVMLYPDGVLCNPSRDSKVLHVFTGSWLKHKRSALQEFITKIKSRLDQPWKVRLYQFLFRGKSKK